MNDVVHESSRSTDAGAQQSKSPGPLVLIVGPSGAGKDSVIDGLKAIFDSHPRVFFPSRVITRPADAGGEAHNSADAESFEQQRAAGAFLLSWRAHGHAYGIPIDVRRHLAKGHCVICNVSRTVIDIARAANPNTHVMLVTASPATLKSRIAARGRESAEETERRVQRASRFTVAGPRVAEIRNDGALEDAVREAEALLLAVL